MAKKSLVLCMFLSCTKLLPASLTNARAQLETFELPVENLLDVCTTAWMLMFVYRSRFHNSQ